MSSLPADAPFRLALVRLLSARGRVTPEQVATANAAAKAGGLLITHLQQAGVDPEHLLSAWSGATGLPAAPRLDVRRPPKGVAKEIDAQACEQLVAVPFRSDPKGVQLAFAVPPSPAAAAALPKHVAWVCLEADIRSGQASLWPKKDARPAPEPEVAAPPAALAPEAPGMASETPSAAFFAPGNQAFGDEDPLAAIDMPPPPPPPPPAASTAASKAAPSTQVRSRGPTDEELKSIGAIDVTGLDARSQLADTAKRFAAPAVGIAVAAGLIFGVVKLIDHSRRETERSGAELGNGMRAAARDMARERAREMGAPLPPAEGRGAGDVGGAMAQVDIACAANDVGAFVPACEALATAVRDESMAGGGAMRMSDLRNLAMELTVMCNREYVGDTPNTEWADVKARLSRVLAGDNPREGPRYQLDQPPAVTSAAANVDAALSQGDVEATCAALSRWRFAILDWLERFPPGPRLVRMHQLAEGTMETDLMRCSDIAIDSLRTLWARYQREIAPAE